MFSALVVSQLLSYCSGTVSDCLAHRFYLLHGSVRLDVLVRQRLTAVVYIAVFIGTPSMSRRTFITTFCYRKFRQGVYPCSSKFSIARGEGGARLRSLA